MKQNKILVTLEGAVLGAGLGPVMVHIVYALTKTTEFSLTPWVVGGITVFSLWFMSCMNGRAQVLDNLWGALIGKEDDSADGYAMAEAEVNESRQDAELWSQALIKPRAMRNFVRWNT